MLPFFTHHPSSFPTVMLIVLVTVVELASVLRVRPSWRRGWHDVSTQPLLLLSALFTVAAFLSLSSLPLVGIWREHAAASAGEPWTAWPRRALEWILLTEVRREFPITSAMLVLQGCLLALIVWREIRVSGAAGALFARAITLGAVVFVALGPLTGATGLTIFALLVSWQCGGWVAGAVGALYLAHNVFIQTLAGTGIIGAVLLAAILRDGGMDRDSDASNRGRAPGAGCGGPRELRPWRPPAAAGDIRLAIAGRRSPARREDSRDAIRMTTALRRELGLAAVTAVVAGNMLGSGIFFTPGELAAVATEPWQVYFFWALCGVRRRPSAPRAAAR